MFLLNNLLSGCTDEITKFLIKLPMLPVSLKMIFSDFIEIY